MWVNNSLLQQACQIKKEQIPDSRRGPLWGDAENLLKGLWNETFSTNETEAWTSM